MKAISVKQPWASMIASGEKTLETRTWNTKHRGEILIVASKNPKIGDLPTGVAICIVTIIDCRQMLPSDEFNARCKVYKNARVWVLGKVTKIKPFAVKGRLSVYNVNL